jgi:uncharacterized membrane protein YqiK
MVDIVIWGCMACFVLGLLLVGIQHYRKCPSNCALVRTGLGGEQIILWYGLLAFPIIHRVAVLSLEPVRVEIAHSGTSSERAPTGFTVMVGTSDELLRNTARRVLDMDSEQIKQHAAAVITDQLSHAASGANKFTAEELELRIRSALAELGLELVSFS